MKIGKLYVSRHTERRDDELKDYELVIFCTGHGVKSKWGNYDTLSGVVIKQTDKFSDHSVGTYSDTWNFKLFIEYNKPITIDNKDWLEVMPVGGCCGYKKK